MAQWGIKYITGMNFPPEGNTLIPQRLASSLIDPYQTYGVTRPVGPLGRGLGSSSANPNDIHSIFLPLFLFRETSFESHGSDHPTPSTLQRSETPKDI